MFKKLITIVISFTLLLNVLSVVSFADSEEIPTIFVDGIVSSDIINTDTGEVIFPPSTSSIIKGVSVATLPLLSAVADKNYDKLKEPLGKALEVIFADVLMDENGLPVVNSDSEFTYPTTMEEARACVEEKLPDTPENYYRFTYDWRLDIKTLANKLHDYIEYILDFTGASKVNLIGFSMGSAVTMTYLHDYDYEHVNSVVILAGAFNGVSSCGEPFSGRIGFDGAATVRFVDTILGEGFIEKIVSQVMKSLYASGIMDKLVGQVNAMSDAIMDYIYEETMRITFARMPGIWALIPPAFYNDAKEIMLGEDATDEFLAKIDYYHYNIQANNQAIIDEMLSRGINFGIVAKYGYTIPPVVKSINNIGDMVIDTVYESFGATCATADKPFGDDYSQAVSCSHNHISADKMIDASSCKYPEYTWFIKGLLHASHIEDEYALCDYILESENQVTVHDNQRFSQFLVNDNGKLAPLTLDNVNDKYGEVTSGDNFIAKVFDIIFKIISKILSFFKIL